MPLIGASVLFALFVINVAMERSLMDRFWGVGEILVLAANVDLFRRSPILQKKPTPRNWTAANDLPSRPREGTALELRKNDDLKSAERRKFPQSAQTGVSLQALGLPVQPAPWSTEAAPKHRNEERDRENQPSTSMTIATAMFWARPAAYQSASWTSKENIAERPKRHSLCPSGPRWSASCSGALVQSVQGGTIQAAQHSLFPNFATVRIGGLI